MVFPFFKNYSGGGATAAAQGLVPLVSSNGASLLLRAAVDLHQTWVSDLEVVARLSSCLSVDPRHQSFTSSYR
jgi:hypothetical protein